MSVPELVPFNINNYVRIRVTPTGRKVHDAYYAALFMKPPEIVVDSDGWTRDQLWHVMHIFGEACFNGAEVPFETEIMIERDTE